MEFSEKLQELRKSRGLTQEELAEALYVSRTAVSKWESGRGYPSIDSLKVISNYFTVTILFLSMAGETYATALTFLFFLLKGFLYIKGSYLDK